MPRTAGRARVRCWAWIHATRRAVACTVLRSILAGRAWIRRERRPAARTPEQGRAGDGAGPEPGGGTVDGGLDPPPSLVVVPQQRSGDGARAQLLGAHSHQADGQRTFNGREQLLRGI